MDRKWCGALALGLNQKPNYPSRNKNMLERHQWKDTLKLQYNENKVNVS